LRHVIEHPEEAKAKAERDREHIRAHLTREHAAGAAERRLHELRRRPIRRHAPANPAPAAVVASRPKISVTMIVKNEAQNIAACLNSFADLVGEVIVVDTGSTDDTVAIAKRMGATVFHFPWIDHFAAARNESLRHTTSEWVFCAFCERARQCGFRIMADTRIRLWHLGSYPFGWEDAGSTKERFANYNFHFGGG
jgi:hypothetical protein